MNPTDTPFECESRFDRVFGNSPRSGKRQNPGKLNAKVVYCDSRKLLDSDSVLPTWGRQQFAAVESYEESIAAKEIWQQADLLLQHDWLHVPAVVFIATHHEGHKPEAARKSAFTAFVEHALDGVFSTVPPASVIKLYRCLRTLTDSAEKLRQLRSWLETTEQQISGLIGTSSDPIVLEQFNGVVDHIEGKTAFVTLTTEMGEELIGEYSADEFAELGIRERRRFTCQTVVTNGEVEVLFQPIPDIEVTSDEEAAIDRELDELISGGELDGDY